MHPFHVIHLTVLGALLMSLSLIDALTQEAIAHHIARTDMLTNMMTLAVSTLGKATAWQLMMKAVMKESCVLSTGLLPIRPLLLPLLESIPVLGALSILNSLSCTSRVSDSPHKGARKGRAYSEESMYQVDHA